MTEVVLETRAGLRVSVELVETANSAVVQLGGLNCDLEGEEPGRYLLVPHEPPEAESPAGWRAPDPAFGAGCAESIDRWCPREMRESLAERAVNGPPEEET
jgi:hypothetical protein